MLCTLSAIGANNKFNSNRNGHSHSNTTARYAHITQVVRENSSDRIEMLLDGFQLRWEEGM